MMALTSRGIAHVRRRVEERHAVLRPLAIILVVLVASVVLGPLASPVLLIALVASPLLLLFYHYPPVGLLALILAGLMVPGGIGTGTETQLHVTVLLLMVLTVFWVLQMVLRREVRLYPSATIPPLLALNIAVVIAFAAGNLPWYLFARLAPLVAQIGGVGIFLLSACAFLLTAHQLPDIRWLKRLVWFFLGVAGLYILGRAIPGSNDLITRFFAPHATGGLFWTWFMALALSQGLINKDLDRRWRILLLLASLATLYISMVPGRQWTSGWLPALAATLAIILLVIPVWARIMTLLAITVVGVLGFDLIYEFIMVGDNEYSWTTRVEAWRIVIEIIKVNPVTGLGPSNYYWYTPLFPILGWEVRFNSHNQYVDLIAQAGLLGFACFVWFSWAVGRLAWQLRQRATSGFSLAYACGCLGGLSGSLVAGFLGDWLLPFAYNVGVKGMRASILAWLFMGGLVALERFMNGRAERSEPDGTPTEVEVR